MDAFPAAFEQIFAQSSSETLRNLLETRGPHKTATCRRGWTSHARGGGRQVIDGDRACGGSAGRAPSSTQVARPFARVIDSQAINMMMRRIIELERSVITLADRLHRVEQARDG